MVVDGTIDYRLTEQDSGRSQWFRCVVQKTRQKPIFFRNFPQKFLEKKSPGLTTEIDQKTRQESVSTVEIAGFVASGQRAIFQQAPRYFVGTAGRAQEHQEPAPKRIKNPHPGAQETRTQEHQEPAPKRTENPHTRAPKSQP